MHEESVKSRNLNTAPQNPERSGYSAFCTDETGSMTVMGIFLFLIILLVGGIGVDLMRYERDRAALQYTMDRAVLAAADLDQRGTPESVVRDYLEKAGLLEYLTSIDVTEGLGYRRVSAAAVSEFPTQFMHMSGVETLSAPANSTAEESIGGVEISLVLDVSGSMNSNSRLPNLKVAAQDFVDTMVSNTEDGKLSISIVPYASQVSVPDSIFNQLSVSSEQNYSNCVNFASNDFQKTSILTTDPLQRTMHFNPFYDFDERSRDPKYIQGMSSHSYSLPVCEARQDREIMPMQKDANTLKTYIQNFVARGNTSLEIGMKWGTALLDPNMRPVVGQLIANGDVPNDFSARPHAFDDGETLKVIVLMTDGENTTQYYIKNGYRTGNSTVWWNDAEEKYSIYNPQNGLYFWPFADDLNTADWQDHAYGNGTYEECTSYYYGNCYSSRTRSEGGSATELSFGDLWAYTSLKWNLYDNFRPWMGSSANSKWYYDVRGYLNSSTKNSRTYNICDAAKNSGIIVYTIGFEAPSGGTSVLKKCASSDSHFYDVDGLEIADAFASIASSIRKLRLTQ